MFVAVVCDFSNDDHRDTIKDLLLQYGLKQVIKNLFESTEMNETQLARLKKDIDRETDSYDSIRIYQFPLENTLVISEMEHKKWRKLKIIK
ncbi:MAG: CRISPR-associated endonuclease Cas2 [Spirochaetales bacterium]|nr:CRISPR-associated endonuclease Cas2 [Spirochaetales bacterium]